MNFIDIIILLLLAWSLIRGFKNGLFIEVASVAALILGIWGSIRFSGFTAHRLIELFDMQSEYLGLISFILTFVIIVVLVHFLARVIDKLMKAVALGFIVRILGMAFAVVKVVLILSIFFVILETVDQKKKLLPSESIESSRLYRPIADFAPMLFPIIEGGDLLESFRNLRNRRVKSSDETTI
jgi:membrane protein required for colicin V production